MKKLLEAIAESDETELDASWAILKYKSLGILRKLKVLALIYCLEESEVIEEAPKDANGRILDFSTRSAIHDVLLKVSQKL